MVNLEPGVYNKRFEITLRNNLIKSGNNLIKLILFIYQNNAIQSLEIQNLNNIIIKSFFLFDLTGKKFFSKFSLGTETNYQISTNELADAVYLFELTSEDYQK